MGGARLAVMFIGVGSLCELCRIIVWEFILSGLGNWVLRLEDIRTVEAFHRRGRLVGNRQE